jgi:basic membrane lipoprotein Med (substrate-binding protein (PBP1-ABC) superfamily)
MRRIQILSTLSALALGLGAITAAAAEKPVALIIAQGGLGDQSYNDLAYSGFKKALAEDKLEGRCHIAVRRARENYALRIFKPPRRPHAMWSSPRRVARGVI